MQIWRLLNIFYSNDSINVTASAGNTRTFETSQYKISVIYSMKNSNKYIIFGIVPRRISAELKTKQNSQ